MAEFVLFANKSLAGDGPVHDSPLLVTDYHAAICGIADGRIVAAHVAGIAALDQQELKARLEVCATDREIGLKERHCAVGQLLVEATTDPSIRRCRETRRQSCRWCGHIAIWSGPCE